MLTYSSFGPVNGCTPKEGYVKLNRVPVWQASWCGSFPNERGINTFLVDPFSCSVQQLRRFDTHASAAAANDLSNHLQLVNHGSIIVV